MKVDNNPGMSRSQVAAALGISIDAVRRAEEKAIRKLRVAYHNGQLRPEILEYIRESKGELL